MAVVVPQTGNALLDRALRGIGDALNKLLRTAIQHEHEQVLTLTTGNTRVGHNLGREPARILVTKAGAGGVVYSDTPDVDPTTHVQLKASVAGTYTVLFE